MVHTRHFTILGVKELLNGLRTYPPILNADSEATVKIGMDNTSCTIVERIETFHYSLSNNERYQT